MLPLPPHWNPDRVGEVWRVDYAARFEDAERWRAEQSVRPAADDRFRIALVVVDVQNTFCTPGFELFVAGRSGTGALDDSRRLCEFVYRNLGSLTQIVPTLDTHQALQIFHRALLVDAEGRHPEPFTLVTAEDVEAGRWRINPPAADGLGLDPDYAEEHLRYYTRTLEEGGKYNLTIWPFHAMLGGIGYALVSALEEALFFHSIARSAPLDFQPKGDNPLTEHYSMLGPEVEYDLEGEPLGKRNHPLIERLLQYDAVVIAGRGQEPLRRLDDRGPALGPDRAGARARGEGLPARGLHLARRRARLGRLHRRGRRRISRASPSRARTSCAPTSRLERVARRRRRVGRSAG